MIGGARGAPVASRFTPPRTPSIEAPPNLVLIQSHAQRPITLTERFVIAPPLKEANASQAPGAQQSNAPAFQETWAQG